MATNGIRSHYDIEDAVEHLYDVYTFGRTILTTVTKHAEAVEQWIKDVKPDDVVHRYIGLEVELFGDLNKRPRIGTLQLCVGTRCLVIQLFQLSKYSAALDQFLTDANNTFVGLNLEFKLNLLIEQFPITGVLRFKDLGEIMAERFHRPGLSNAGQKVLVRIAFGMELERPRAEIDWGRTAKLSDVQVQYACIEAFVCFELGRWLIREPDV